MAPKEAVGAPSEELGHRKCHDFTSALLDDKIVDGEEVGSGEAQFREQDINTVHPEGVFAAQLGQVGLAQAGAVANDKGALAAMDVFQGGQSAHAFPPPGMQVRRPKVREAGEGVVSGAGRVPEGSGGNLFEDFENSHSDK